MVKLCLFKLRCLFLFFFFKQKTAYEMRISDWSSDVCSSDLTDRGVRALAGAAAPGPADAGIAGAGGEIRRGGLWRPAAGSPCRTGERDQGDRKRARPGGRLRQDQLSDADDGGPACPFP